MTPRSILIVKLGAVGDCVHTLYALRALREAFPDARIGWAIEDKSRAVIEDHPDLSEIIRFPRKELAAALRSGGFTRLWRAFRADLRARGYEIAIDFQNLFKSGHVAHASGAPRRIGFRKWREGNFLFTNERIPRDPNARHAIEKYFTLLRPLGVTKIPERVEIAIPAEKRETIDRWFTANGLDNRRLIAINPGASWPNKKLSARTYAAAADALSDDGCVPVVIWGPGEERDAAAVVESARSPVLLAPRTDIRELAALLGRCAMYVGNDSGPMHIAAAMGARTLGVFGPTDPARVGPWSPRGRAVQASVTCGPCWKKRCPGPVNCIDRVEAATLIRECRALLETP
ncbi:MAG: glycosyltransferase family 9 protein [Deltaproteobacteria bacterium]|nr:glycosyltransferase family 9 protein [Deltaproteobacteria bacterium]